jgi:nitrate reductase gamma subunit
MAATARSVKRPRAAVRSLDEAQTALPLGGAPWALSREGEMELLEFARGPGLWFSLAVFLLGSAWRLWGIFRRPVKADHAAPRGTAVVAGALRAVVSRMWHHETFRRRTLGQTLNAYAYHVGLAIVFFGFLPHIEFLRRLTGLSWPAVPGWLFVIAVAAVFIGLIVALAIRIGSPVARLLSSFDDWFSWFVTLLPMITGMAVISLPLDEAYPRAPADPVPVAIHLLSLELLLVWLPFGKLAHAFLVFVSRGMTGAAFARKGAGL